MYTQYATSGQKMSTGRVMAISVCGSLAVGLIFLLIFVLAARADANRTQDCEDWTVEYGYSQATADEYCHLMWNFGYDTKDITREEFEWNAQELEKDVTEFGERVDAWIRSL